MNDNRNTELNVDEIVRRIKEEVARNKQGRPTSAVRGIQQRTKDHKQASPAAAQPSGLFGFVKRIQMIAAKLPFYSTLYRIAVKFKRFVK